MTTVTFLPLRAAQISVFTTFELRASRYIVMRMAVTSGEMAASRSTLRNDEKP